MKTVSTNYIEREIAKLIEDINLTDFSEDEIIDYVTCRYTLEEVRMWYEKEVRDVPRN